MIHARPQVLVIDDAPGVRDLLARELGRDGFDVTCVADGVAAADIVRARKFDVVVADLKGSGMAGAQSVAALKAIDPGLEVIIATAAANTSNVVECMKGGAFDLIEKPYDIADLKQVIAAAMERGHLDAVARVHTASAALIAHVVQEGFPQSAVDAAAKVVPCSAAGLLLSNPEGRAGKSGFAHYSAATGSALSAGFLEQLARQAHYSVEPLRLAGWTTGTLTGPAGERFAWAVVCPLRVGGRPLGGLALLRDESLQPFTPQEVHAIDTLAITIALALECRRLERRG